jgi:hypothetical protein
MGGIRRSRIGMSDCKGHDDAGIVVQLLASIEGDSWLRCATAR